MRTTADIVIERYGDLAEPLVTEGPFGDHTGWYSLEDQFPLFHLTAITHRSNPIYLTTIVPGAPGPGHAAWSTNVKVWFVMIKDRKGRFKNNDHWGDGWGWALFEADDPNRNVSAGYRTSCVACHVPVRDSDWVYVYGYPELKKPK